MRKCGFLSFFFFLSIYSLFSQVEIKRTVFVPPEYYMGDPVELRLQIELEESGVVIIPENIDNYEWVEIKDIQVNQNDRNAEIIIKFTSFSPGTRALPELDFGSFMLSDFKIYTNSLVEEGENELKGLRAQVLIPGSRLYFFLLAAAAFILPYLFYFFVKFLIHYLILLTKKYYTAKPYRTLNRILKRLDSNLEKTSVRDFFITLSDAMRIYLTARTGFDCKSATTSEISLLHGFGLEGDLWERFVTVLKKGDLVKFGGEKLSHSQMKENLDFVITLCQEIEKREDFHVNL
ncbi:MAG: hypothetical protein PF518_11780 [Spirochaetaceae bacterium]|jgi:hypothetical protein|nr:hypothetical protein [Spirochaetaceae bacterium]